MLSLVAAIVLIVLLVLAFKLAIKNLNPELSVRGIFEKMHKMLHSEEIQNANLDPLLRTMLRRNEPNRALGYGYGYSPNNPIRVNGPLGEQLYIAMLRGLDGQVVIGHRLGSLNTLDIYEVATSDFSQWAVLFFDMYYQNKDIAAPAEFAIDTSGTRTLTAVNKFMANFPNNFYYDLIETVKDQIGFPLINTSIREIYSDGITRPAAHQDLMNHVVVVARAEGIGVDS